MKIGRFNYEQQENGGMWILKSIDPKRPDGTLKPEYKDLPRFKLIYKYEDQIRNQFNEMLQQAFKQIIQELKNGKSNSKI